MSNSIRAVEKHDLPGLKAVIDTSGLFPSEMLDDMMAGYFSDPASAEIWLTCEINSTPAAVAYCAPERLTSGTYNLYLIAVHAAFRGQGLGSRLMAWLEDLLASRGERILIVETSGLPEYEKTRRFYEKGHYHREAVIRDFYQEGEDKVVFLKKLTRLEGEEVRR